MTADRDHPAFNRNAEPFFAIVMGYATTLMVSTSGMRSQMMRF